MRHEPDSPWNVFLYGPSSKAMLQFSVGCFYLCSGSRSDIPGKFLNVVLEKDGEDQLDRSCEK